MSDHDFYGPVVLTGGGSLRPGDDGFEEAQASAVHYEIPPLDLSASTFIGYTWDGRFFLSGEGEVSLDRFNEALNRAD